MKEGLIPTASPLQPGYLGSTGEPWDRLACGSSTASAARTIINISGTEIVGCFLMPLPIGINRRRCAGRAGHGHRLRRRSGATVRDARLWSAATGASMTKGF
jgi:acyl-coenzyme A synthetase/AMP-(fatty) acid ligase